MASFIENIIKSEAGQQVLDMARNKLQSGAVQDILGQVTRNANLGVLTSGVINVIGLATGAVNRKV